MSRGKMLTYGLAAQYQRTEGAVGRINEIARHDHEPMAIKDGRRMSARAGRRPRAVRRRLRWLWVPASKNSSR
jgi:hypothetical protein